MILILLHLIINKIITGLTRYNGRKDVKIIVPLKCFNSFWRTLEIPLINCQINIVLTWSEKCIIVTRDYGDNANKKPKFKIQIMFRLWLY